jgi:hypothetical protein
MKNKLLVAMFAVGAISMSGAIAQNVNRSTSTTVTTDQGQTTQIGDQSTMDTKSGKKARKAEKKVAKGKEHKALKKQAKADDKEAVGR